MLFAFIILLVVIATAVYVTKRTKTTIDQPTTSTEATPSIHEEIAKIVEEVKAQKPIEPVVDKAPKAKPAPKMDAKPKTQAKPKAPKKKTVNA